ncbi:inositol monophosphatase [Aureimonas endophytica]|uniref:Inositol-1-monophosphatase n=1 Tax=Aureimonas endophytica TaxID=2027858 RepID=A0A916ZZL5_9HYPH|nr:inositol monophosphatase family protein [Aureimonas endophytica]GGE20446.1 inositol monophosphatase [Aureimonas endophytica]
MSLSSHLSPTASPRLQALAAAALKGGAIARAGLTRRRHGDLLAKAPRDYQTEMDVAVERAIVADLVAAFPDHAIDGEEEVGNRKAPAGAPVIFIDPIDGTTNYAWGIPHFGLTIAIVEGGDVVAGVVYDAMLGELFSAEAGKGAFLNGAPIAAIDNATVEDSLIGAGLPVPSQVRSVPEDVYFGALRRLMAETAGVRRLGSAALSIAYVACGRLDGFFEDGLSLHDYGAAMLLLREAGGIVTSFAGGAVRESGDILAANRAIHPWLLAGFAPAG